MAERMMLIHELQAFATAAVERGDDRAADLLREAAQLLFDDFADLATLERRRTKDRLRKQQHSTDSAESTESASVLKGFPTPLPKSPNNTTTHTAREALRREEDGENIEVLSALMSGQMGDNWSTVDAFVKRRPVHTWYGWLRGMAAEIGPGSQYLPADLAAACRDDEALSVGIGSMAILRTFLARSKAERSNPPRGNNGAKPGLGQRAYDTTLEAIKDM